MRHHIVAELVRTPIRYRPLLDRVEIVARMHALKPDF